MTTIAKNKWGVNEYNYLSTNSTCTTELVLPADFSALHIAHLCWDLYSSTAPTCFSGEFTISDNSDFAMYNIEDKMDMSQHYYDAAFSIAASVKANLKYSVQDAYEDATDISADTTVREDVLDSMICAIKELIANESEWIKHTKYILADYQELDEIVYEKLNKQLAAIANS